MENETILLEKRLAELRTVRDVDNDQMDRRLTSKSTKFIWQGGRVRRSSFVVAVCLRAFR